MGYRGKNLVGQHKRGLFVAEALQRNIPEPCTLQK